MKKAVPFLLILLLLKVGDAPGKTDSPLPIKDLAVAKSLGKVQERFQGKGDRWVIQIQDIHAHYAAQENIAAIIDQLSEVYGVKTIALEGGWSQTSFAESWGLPTSREKNMLATGLMDEEYITGPAYAALFSKMPLNLVGIEEMASYEENRHIYLKHIAERPAILARLKVLGEKIAALMKQTYSPDLLAFDQALGQFREGKNAEKFMPALIEKAGSLGIDFADLAQVLLFKKIIAQEKSIRKEKLESEAKRIMQAHKNSRLSFEEILKSGKIPKEKLAYYPESGKYLELFKLQDQLAHDVLFQQIDELIKRVKQKIFTTDEERALDERGERYQLAKKIILFEATPLDLRSYENQKDVIGQEMREEELDGPLVLALSFYAVAKKRDEIFFEKISSDKRLEGNVAVVTGGFHTEGLSQLLRNAEISYVTIMPEIGTEPPDEALYFKRLQDFVPQTQTLSHIQNRFLTSEFDQAFVQGVRVLRSTNNKNKAVEAVVNYAPVSAAEIQATQNKASPLTGVAKLTPAERMDAVRKILKEIKESKLPIVIIIRSTTLAQLLKNDVGLTIWEEIIAPDRNNTVGLIQDGEYLDQTIGTKAQIVRVPATANIGTVAKKRFKGARVAVIDADYASTEVLTLPPHPTSLLFARRLLEQGVKSAADLASDFLDIMEETLQQIFMADGILRRSA